ncbi:amidohydrolase family protein [Salipiger sp.]|uniref:amidohydrolase family protein n=1 Tax=Salipiger sp. TaxID=2078585 RepID=UPI003A97C975
MTTDIPVFGRVHPVNEEWLARAAPETPLEPDLAIVDPHVHLWNHFPDQPYLLPHHARDLRESGHDVVASIHVECKTMYRTHGPDHLRPLGETEFVAALAATADRDLQTKTRIAAGIVAFADLRQGDKAVTLIQAHTEAAQGRLVGIRQVGKWDSDPRLFGLRPGKPDDNAKFFATERGLYGDPAFRRGLRRLADLGLCFDASVFHPQLSELADLARAVPEARIVLVHNGSPVGHAAYAGPDSDTHRIWLDGMKRVADCPNVSIKLGGMLMNLGNYDFLHADAPIGSAALAELWHPWIAPCLDLFGPERCMASSNFPVEKAGMSYGTLWNMFKRVTASCSDDARNMIFGGTARRVYGLQL